MLKYFFLFILFVFSTACLPAQPCTTGTINYYIADPAKQEVRMYWKSDAGKLLLSLERLRAYLQTKKKKLLFATNGGMYMTDSKPLGLYIENGKQLRPLNKRAGTGNFYLKPNGVFWIGRDNKAHINITDSFLVNKNVWFATQSGPMLIANGKIHSGFTPGSLNYNIRSGVGILADGKIIFAITALPQNFYDFASFFLKFGCKNALFLDGGISEAYFVSENAASNYGVFGAIIGVTKK